MSMLQGKIGMKKRRKEITPPCGFGMIEFLLSEKLRERELG